MPAFTAFRPKYTQPFIDAFRLQILAAEALPGEQARNSAIEVASIQLRDDYGKAPLNRWQDLKRYIIGAYAPNIQKAKLEEAGQLDYASAADWNWDKLRSLITQGRNFLTANSAALLANDNMPAGFTAAYTAAGTTATTKINQFVQLRDNKATLTGTKIIANNAIMDIISEIANDGQAIFRDDVLKKDQFVVDRLLELVDGPGTSGIRGYVLDAVTEQPIPEVNLTIINTDKSDVSDVDGRYQILQAAGTYSLRVEVAGYQPQEIPITIPLGHLTSETILLLPE